MTKGDAWLKHVTGWWRTLAAGLAERQPANRREACELTARQTIESLVLLRLCQDRGLAPADTLAACGARGGGASHLFQGLDWLESQYGSTLCRVRRGTSADEEFSPRPTIDLPDDLLEPIVRQLSGPNALALATGPQILGQTHERLLDLRLSGTNRLAKRAAGVYYTPDYVCQYIVERTLAEVPDGSWSLLDPACGAGSFLLAACRRLRPGEPKPRPPGLTGPPHAARLGPVNLAGRLHGVDLDPEAVLTARRSLWLEIIAAEPTAGVDPQMARAVAERLESSIEWGNVLLDPIWQARAAASIGSWEIRPTAGS